jgi:hypothetical protein
MTAPSTDLPTPVPHETGPMHGCVRCGARVPVDVALCDECNPLGLTQPSASQAHGTIALGLFVGVVGIAIFAKLAISGIGPFTGSVVDVAAQAPGLAVTLDVTNQGSKAGTTSCRVYDPSDTGMGSPPTMVLSPRVEPGATLRFTQVVTTLGPTVMPLAADCR